MRTRPQSFWNFLAACTRSRAQPRSLAPTLLLQSRRYFHLGRQACCSCHHSRPMQGRPEKDRGGLRLQTSFRIAGRGIGIYRICGRGDSARRQPRVYCHHRPAGYCADNGFVRRRGRRPAPAEDFVCGACPAQSRRTGHRRLKRSVRPCLASSKHIIAFSGRILS